MSRTAISPSAVRLTLDSPSRIKTDAARRAAVRRGVGGRRDSVARQRDGRRAAARRRIGRARRAALRVLRRRRWSTAAGARGAWRSSAPAGRATPTPSGSASSRPRPGCSRASAGSRASRFCCAAPSPTVGDGAGRCRGLHRCRPSAAISTRPANASGPRPTKCSSRPPKDRRRPPALETAVERGRILGDSCNLARALSNEPSNVLTPRVFAERAAADREGRRAVSVEVLDEKAIERLGMGLLLGVARGSVGAAARHRDAARAAGRAEVAGARAGRARASRSTPAASRSSRPTAWSG